MSVLDIEHKGGENYIFSAKGCHLKYFVIWAEGDTPRWEPIDGEPNDYKMSYTLENNKIYNFHVYDGNESKDFRGKMKYETYQTKNIM